MIKFLIIRFSSIGDIVLTTPVIRCLNKQVEGVEIHYLTKLQYAEILQSSPYISKVHILKARLKGTIEELKLEFFDYIIDLHNNIRTFRVKQNLGLPVFSFKKLNLEKWLMVNFKINKLPGLHIVDRYLETLKVFDVHNDNDGLDFFIPEKDELIPSEISPAANQGYIAFAIGARHFTKRLPADKIIEICNGIELPVILLGGKEDESTGNQISASSPGKVFTLCGRLNINQSASVIRQAKVVITHDSGMMHIASAFHKIIISVWGNTIPAFGMYPYLPDPGSRIIEIHGLKCRPCSKIGFGKCPENHFRCMKNINNDEIISLAKELFLS